jgi:hypothetical protein
MIVRVVLSLIVLFLLPCCSGQYTRWEQDISVNGMEFKRVRHSVRDGDTVMTIGYLKQSALVNGILCRADWIHLDSEMNPVLFQLEEEAKMLNSLFPKGTWIVKMQDGLAVVFPTDTVIQGYSCLGGGGPNGIRTSFYNNGNLKFFYAAKETEFEGIKCKGGSLHTISLHENGALQGCTLAKASFINGNWYKRGEKIRFDQAGRVVNHNTAER